MKWQKKSDFLAILLILCIISLFFLPLFYPIQKIIVTPDFGGIDAWHASLAMKYITWKNLQNGSLPLWSPLIGSGQPLLGDAYGIFYLPNLIFFTLLTNFVTAYNLYLVFSVMLFGLGIYLWMRILKCTPLISSFSAVTLSLSGIIIPRLTHIMVIPALSLLPWVMIATHLLSIHTTKKRFLLLTCIISQQILSSFPQVTFITLLFAVSYFLFLTHKQPGRFRYLLVFTTAIFCGLGLSAIQLLPSYEYLRFSIIPSGFLPSGATYFSFPLSHIKTFLDPYALGDPRNGSYPFFSQFDGSIFWENSGYVGIIPLLLFIYSVGTFVRNYSKEKSKIVLFFLCIGIASFLLMLGKYSPIYFIYSFWPFNIFRTPSRFIWTFVISIVVISGFGLGKITHTYLRLIVVGIQIAQIFLVWKSYHRLEIADDWLAPPSIVLAINPDERVYTVGIEQAYNQIYKTNGWQDMESYRFLNNGLKPNSNVFWNIAHFRAYPGLRLYRSSALETILAKEITNDEKTASLSAFGTKLLELFSIGTIISETPINNSSLTKSSQIKSKDQTITAYRLGSRLPRVYLATDVQVATTVESARDIIENSSFIPGKSVLVETPVSIEPQDTVGQASILNETDTSVTVRVQNNAKMVLLVLSDTYYPGWSALVDGKEEQILPVNIRSRGVLVPAGDHRVEFQYQPISLRNGAYASAFFLLFIVCLTVFPFRFFSFYIPQKRRPLFLYRRRSRGTS